MEPEPRQELLAEIAALLGRPDAPVESGLVMVPMRTDVYWTRSR